MWLFGNSEQPLATNPFPNLLRFLYLNLSSSSCYKTTLRVIKPLISNNFIKFTSNFSPKLPSASPKIINDHLL